MADHAFPEEQLDSPLGYFPCNIGDKLDGGRWTIVRKLGWGPRSSTWLAQASKEAGGQYGAVKVLTAEATADSSGNRERDALQGPVKSIPYGVPELLKYFYEHDPSGKRHLCLVFRMLGTTVEDLRLSNEYDGQYLPAHVVKKIVGGVAVRLVGLHRNKLVHGAVTADNFYFFGPQSVPDIQRELSKSQTERPIKISSNGNTYSTVKSQPFGHDIKWDSSSEELFDVTIYLCNYGHTHQAGVSAEIDTPKNHASPEALKGERLDGKSDIWTLGCTAYLLLTGTPLFDEAYVSSPVETATQTLEKLESLLKESEKLADDDIAPTAAFLRSCLAIKPTNRDSASEIAEGAWVKSGCKCAMCSG